MRRQRYKFCAENLKRVFKIHNIKI
uniref:Uncharacterized protein n=1 Tax=Anguilla anguilla TaxID=7936 RepID=A0A0E9UI34_ANGAN